MDESRDAEAGAAPCGGAGEGKRLANPCQPLRIASGLGNRHRACVQGCPDLLRSVGARLHCGRWFGRVWPCMPKTLAVHARIIPMTSRHWLQLEVSNMNHPVIVPSYRSFDGRFYHEHKHPSAFTLPVVGR